MSTRAGSLSKSQRVTEKLVRLLFQGKENHNPIDFTSHSYDNLRKAYIARVHQLHPDKYNSIKEKSSAYYDKDQEVVLQNWHDGVHYSTITKCPRKSRQEAFVELQEAWDAYERVSKIMKDSSSKNGRSVQENFTLFGVGCSFSDNLEESLMRAEIMDQAGKGWFSAGQLQSKTIEIPFESFKNESYKSDQEYVQDMKGVVDPSESPHDNSLHSSNQSMISKRKRSLVDHLIPPFRR
jgi:hypothetical protein